MPLKNKRGLVMGVVNEHSIAYGCAQAFRAAGVGDLATFLVSDGATALTGNVEYVDAGYHIFS